MVLLDARHGRAGRGEAGQGVARRGKGRLLLPAVGVRPGRRIVVAVTWLGGPWRGWAWHGAAWHGEGSPTLCGCGVVHMGILRLVVVAALALSGCAHGGIADAPYGDDCIYAVRHRAAERKTCLFVRGCPDTRDLDHCVSDADLRSLLQEQKPEPDYDAIFRYTDPDANKPGRKGRFVY